METDQQGRLADEKGGGGGGGEEEEETSCKKQKITQIEQPEIFVDKVKSTIPLQHTNHKAQSSNSTNSSTSVAAEISKEADGKMPFIREISFHEERPLFGNEWENMGAYHSVSKKEAFLGTEESKGFDSSMHTLLGKEPFICIESSSKETSCLMSNAHGTESSDECINSSTSNFKAKISLIGVRRQKNGRYGAVITDKIRHKQVWLGTFDTVEEASQAYFSKKSELEKEKLNQQGNKENLDQILQPESPIVTSLAMANDQTLDDKRIDSHKTTTHTVDVHKNWSGKEPESSKETSCLMASVQGTESSNECNTTASCNPNTKRSLLGIRRQKNGRYGAVITDQIRHKQVWLGTFDTVEEASQAYFSKKFEFEKLSQQDSKDNKPKENCDQIQQPESPAVLASLPVANDKTLDTTSVGLRNKRIDSHIETTYIVGVHKNKTSGKEPESSKETTCLMDNVRGSESYDEGNTSTSCNPKGKISLLGIKRQKNGRYGAVITDTIRHKKVWLGTFDTVEEASQAYFSKKSELENEKLNQQVNKENRPNQNPDQTQQPESPVVATLSITNDQTLNASSVGRRNKRMDSHKATTHIVGVHKNKTSGEEPESSKETTCLVDNAHGTESYDVCNTSTSSDPKAKISLIGIRRQKNGRYAAVITDRIKHKKIWLGTFDTVEEASQAYFSKKSEFEKLSQGNKENKPKKNCDQVQKPESPSVVASLSVANHDQTLNTARVSTRNKIIDSHKTTTHIYRVHKRKNSGKYTSEIRNPISKKRIWLGTFSTAEEASQAYQSKKLEFQKLVDANGKCSNNKQTHSKQDGKSEKLGNVKQGHEHVNCELKSAGGSKIDVHISNSSNDGIEQSIAYQSEKFDLQISKKVEPQSEMPTDSSAAEKQEGQEDGEDLWMGEWVQLPGNREVKFSRKLGLPIIDKYGSLLGEFSTLDDLSICKTEDGNET
ncbi:hypothetical protein HAX54_031348 [Datura stramonium]|uniref:AP2/ERF domain-containing protein n=1 Tax=Datura stramonium TaxID=4076 RepID=A0ABS8V931_DATST|nr:hypothetical protein [Datura stramonium]